MEVEKKSLWNNLVTKFLKEKQFFSTQREINWKLIIKCASASLVLGILVVLIIPEKKKEPTEFKSETTSDQRFSTDSYATSAQDSSVVHQIGAGGYSNQAPSSLSYLYANGNGGSSNNPSESTNSMVISRGGFDSKTSLPPGTRVLAKLLENTTVTDQSLPVIGKVSQDVYQEDILAIPRGSKIYGSISFEGEGSIAKLEWQSIEFPDGRVRVISATSASLDGQMGVYGKIQSRAFRNTIGQALTKFVGSYAEGSMPRGSMGGNPGGSSNGIKNAISETAQERAEMWAENLKKEKRWIEISSQTEFYMVLTNGFSFRDPGGIYGR